MMLLYLLRKTSYCVSKVLSKQILTSALRPTCCLQVQSLVTESRLSGFSPKQRIPKQYAESLQDVINANEDKIERFSSILKCEHKFIEHLVRGDSRIVTSFNYEQVSEKFKILAEYNYSPEEISMYPTVFCFRLAEFAERIATVEPVRTFCSPLSLMSSSKRIFQNKVKEYKADRDILNKRNRFTFIADKLECSVDDVYDLIDTKTNHLLTRRPSVIDAIVNMIKENGFPISEIRKYPYVLDLSVAEARRRFAAVERSNAMKKMSLANILLSNRRTFQNALQVAVKELSYLEGYEDCGDILKRRLEISDEELEALYSKAVMIRGASAKKLQTSLDMLLMEMNIHPWDILRSPSLLYYSVARLKLRHEVLQQAGITKSSEIVLNLRLSEAAFYKRYADIVSEFKVDISDAKK